MVFNCVDLTLSIFLYLTDRSPIWHYNYRSFNHNFRKYFFTARIVNIWNTLPNYVVDVLSADLFKLRLHKFWAIQAIMFDWMQT